MAQYRKKPATIEAVVYTKGMEDGFMKDNGIIPEHILKDGDKYLEKYRSTKHLGYHYSYDDILDNTAIDGWKPYIKISNGIDYVSEGDYIVTGAEGEKYLYKPEVFNAIYEEII